MRLFVIKAYLKKEFRDLSRSNMIFLIYFVPTLIIFLFGYGLKLEIKDAKTLIIDRDNSKTSLQIIEKFSSSNYFDAKVSTMSDKEALKLFKKNKLDVLIIIPPSFQKREEIGIFIDGAFPLRALILEGYILGIISNQKSAINTRNLFNESLRDENAFIPGIIGLVLLIAPAILSALVIVKEKEIGTIFNFYSSPITKLEFLIAKMMLPLILHSINLFILFLWATYYFEVPFRGSFLLYIIAGELFIFISVWIGILVSIFTSTQLSALVLTIIITVIPGFLYSGILMPISSMDTISQIEAHLLPISYFNHILYDCFLVGKGFSSILNLNYLIILLLYAIILVTIGTIFLKKGIR